MRINTNINANIAVNQMAKNTALQSASMEKLSTGLRINKAADDAAGLAISEKMRSQIRGMEQADRNVQDGISMIQTAEGALEEATNIAQRMRELTIQGANDTNTVEDREKINAELSQLGEELGKIAEETKFNEKELLVGEKSKNSAGKTLNSVGFNAMVVRKSSGAVKATYEKLDGCKATTTIAAEAGKEFNVYLGSDGSTLINSTGHKLAIMYEQTDGSISSVVSDQLAIDDNGNYMFKLSTAAKSLTGTDGVVWSKGGTTTINSKDPDVVKIQAGANLETREVESLNLAGIGESLKDLKVSTSNGQTTTYGVTNHDVARQSLRIIDDALKTMNTARSQFGAQQNRLEYTSANLSTSTENLTAAESRIRDVDVAKEMIKLSKYNIITQASQSMAAQAKQQPQGVMQLLN